MEKYISMWNATSRAYIARIGRERERGGFVVGGDIGLDGIASGAAGGGSGSGSGSGELF
jgi:hypothetical protein